MKIWTVEHPLNQKHRSLVCILFEFSKKELKRAVDWKKACLYINGWKLGQPLPPCDTYWSFLIYGHSCCRLADVNKQVSSPLLFDISYFLYMIWFIIFHITLHWYIDPFVGQIWCTQNLNKESLLQSLMLI